MLITPNRQELNKIVVINPKGGCGKTTLSTNIASYFAKRGPIPAIMDCDPTAPCLKTSHSRHRRLQEDNAGNSQLAIARA